MKKYQFPQPLRLIDHRDGSKYPYEVLFDFPVLDENGDVVMVIPGRTRSKEGYRTDLASIPTSALKKLLEPMRIQPTSSEDQVGDWLIYMYELVENGLPRVVGWFRDPVGHAAVPHDGGYFLMIEDRAVVDRRFFDILTQGRAAGRRLMYAAVRAFGWLCRRYPMEDVTEDRILFAEAMDRYFSRNLAVPAG